jgi:Domain of unknown function (DUF5667)
MTSLLGAKRRAEEFSAAVEGRTAASDLRPELAELVGVVDTLRAHESPAPRPEFSAELRERLIAEAETTLATDSVLRLPPRRSGSRERRLALVASSVVLVGGSAGLAAAAQDALPGEALYPIKRGIERVQADVGTSQAGKGRELLEQADNRLVEVQGLLEAGDEVHVAGTIERFTSQADEGAQLLLESFEESQDPAVIEELRGFTSGSLPVLQELAEAVPPDAQDELAAAAAALLDIDERAAGACSACLPELPALRLPELFLTAAEVERATEAIQGTTGGDSEPARSGKPAERPGKVDRRGAQAPVEGRPALPGIPVLPDLTAGTDVRAPRDLDDVVDGAGQAAGGLLDGVGRTVEELVPDELDPVTDPLKDKVKDTVKDPVKGVTDPLKGLTDPLKRVTDPEQGASKDPLLP